MKYCTECGTELEDKYLENEGMIPYCSSCQQYRFPIFNAAVSMIIHDKRAEKILLIQQYGRPFWILVAGYVNRGERAEDTVVREAFEEVRLEVKNVRFNRSRFFEPSNTLMLNFAAEACCEDKIAITDEVDRWQWFAYKEAAQAVKPGSLAAEFLNLWLEDQNIKLKD